MFVRWSEYDADGFSFEELGELVIGFAMGRRFSHTDWPSDMMAEAIRTCAAEMISQRDSVGKKQFKREVKEGLSQWGLCPLCEDRLDELVRRSTVTN